MTIWSFCSMIIGRARGRAPPRPSMTEDEAMSSAVTSIAERADASDLHALMQSIGAAAVACRRTAGAGRHRRQECRRCVRAAAAVRAQADAILAANAEDLRDAQGAGLSGALLDRLRLDAARVEAMARGLEEIARAARSDRQCRSRSGHGRTGCSIARVRVPLGVIGIIYESRPNVTADAGALCLKSGNAAILRGGSESRRSSAAIHACLVRGLTAAGLPAAAIQLVPTTDRAAVGEMLGGHAAITSTCWCRAAARAWWRACRPRRACRSSAISRATATSTSIATPISTWRAGSSLNAKMRRTGVCGAAETLLVDRACRREHLRR